MLIRRERSGDEPGIDAVHTDAFPGPEPVEPGLVRSLRADPAWLPALSMVAVLGTEIAGHVCCTRAHLLPGEHAVLGLGPIGVRPHNQLRGVGHALMHAVLGAADALGEPLVVLLGHPGFYPRFGFVAAATLGIEPPDPAWTTAFQARTLTSYRPELRGEFRYAEPFREL
jgi:putative acetyltransferase